MTRPQEHPMHISQDDHAALRQALGRVQRALETATKGESLDAIHASLLAAMEAASDCRALIRAIDDHTRTVALRELETRLEQQVGMPAESL